MDTRFFHTLARGALHVLMGSLLILGTSIGASARHSTGQSSAGTSATNADVPPPALLSEPHTVSKAINFVGKTLGDTGAEGKDGFYADLDNMPTGSGWLTVGPGFRRHMADGKVFLDGSAAISWRSYKVVQGRVELPRLVHDHLTIGSQAAWRDDMQVNYFGIGPDSLEANRSEYRVRETDVVGYATARANRWLSIDGRIGWLRRPEIHPPAGTFDRGFPDVRLMLPFDPAVLRQEQPRYRHADVSVTADSRNHVGYPTSGGLYRATWSDYSDRDGGIFSFRRYEVEGVQLIPVVAGRWILGVHGFGVFSDVPAGNDVPFYLMPSLGGHNSIRSYSDYRFHDRNLVLVNAESRFGLTTHMDVAVFADAGNVAARAGDLDLTKRAYGVGLRVHTQTSTLLRVEAAHGVDGWEYLVRMNDPFRLSRLKTRTAALPFVQ